MKYFRLEEILFRVILSLKFEHSMNPLTLKNDVNVFLETDDLSKKDPKNWKWE